MKRCPECNGTDFVRDRSTGNLICQNCGLSLPRGKEVHSFRRSLRDSVMQDSPTDDMIAEEKKKRHREYLKWWTSERKD